MGAMSYKNNSKYVSKTYKFISYLKNQQQALYLRLSSDVGLVVANKLDLEILIYSVLQKSLGSRCMTTGRPCEAVLKRPVYLSV